MSWTHSPGSVLPRAPLCTSAAQKTNHFGVIVLYCVVQHSIAFCVHFVYARTMLQKQAHNVNLVCADGNPKVGGVGMPALGIFTRDQVSADFVQLSTMDGVPETHPDSLCLQRLGDGHFEWPSHAKSSKGNLNG